MPGFDSSSLLIPSAGMDAKEKSKSYACLGLGTGVWTTPVLFFEMVLFQKE